MSDSIAVRLRRETRRITERGRDEAAFHLWSATGRGRQNRRNVANLSGRYRGRRCIIMGNGPSLLKCDLNRFASEVTIVSNAHFLIWDTLLYRPTFLTVEDTLVAEDRAEELASISTVTKLFPFDLRHLLPDAEAHTLYVNFPRRYRGFPSFSHDLTKRAYWGGTVSFLNIQLATYLGCDPIVLVGFDHRYHVPPERVTGAVIESVGPDVNHIHPDYFGPGYRWHDPNLARMEAAYRCARRELERIGVRIYNATDGGELEVFDRLSLDSLI
jgi:hypothetical protein